MSQFVCVWSRRWVVFVLVVMVHFGNVMVVIVMSVFHKYVWFVVFMYFGGFGLFVC